MLANDWQGMWKPHNPACCRNRGFPFQASFIWDLSYLQGLSLVTLYEQLLYILKANCPTYLRVLLEKQYIIHLFPISLPFMWYWDKSILSIYLFPRQRLEESLLLFIQIGSKLFSFHQYRRWQTFSTTQGFWTRDAYTGCVSFWFQACNTLG